MFKLTAMDGASFFDRLKSVEGCYCTIRQCLKFDLRHCAQHNGVLIVLYYHLLYRAGCKTPKIHVKGKSPQKKLLSRNETVHYQNNIQHLTSLKATSIYKLHQFTPLTSMQPIR